MIDDQPPIPLAFEFEGRTYQLTNRTLSGTILDRINEAATRSRVKQAVASLRVIETLPETTADDRSIKNTMRQTALQVIANPRALDMQELNAYLKDDPEVVAEVLFRTCETIQTLEEARRILRGSDFFHNISLQIWESSGIAKVLKLPAVAAILGVARPPSGGDETSTDDDSAEQLT